MFQKATLTFDDAEDLKRAAQGADCHSALFEIDDFLRKKVKYGDHSAEVEAAFQEARDALHAILESMELSLL